LILDDSSCALDLKTEYDLYSNLNREDIGDIRIIISQRISTMKMCDKILVIDIGKVSGFGTYSSLIKKNKIFKEIVLSQEEGVSND
jgi:ATP-binding cassette subfamily B protein